MAAARATAVVSEPPRPSVVTSLEVETPWKPATSTIRLSSSAERMRSARTSRMRALVCDVSVTIPAWLPVRLIARWPRSLIAIAHSAQLIRSPVERSMSISRGSGEVETSSAIAISSSVVLPRADRTATTRWPCSLAATIRRAARLRRSASTTDVPPNFITTVPDTRGSLRRRLAQGPAAPGVFAQGTNSRAGQDRSVYRLGEGPCIRPPIPGYSRPPGQVDELNMLAFKAILVSARVQPQEAGVALFSKTIGGRRAAFIGLLACAAALSGSALVQGATGPSVTQAPTITGTYRVGQTVTATG